MVPSDPFHFSGRQFGVSRRLCDDENIGDEAFFGKDGLGFTLKPRQHARATFSRERECEQPDG